MDTTGTKPFRVAIGRSVARPSLDDPAVVEALCDRIASGEGIAEICAKKDAPSEREVYRRMGKDEIFASRIARAREAQQEFEADHCVTLADKATAEDWQIIRLRIWARQWRASKLAPRKYGTEKLPPGQQNNQLNVVNVNLAPGEYEEIAKRLLSRL